MFWADVVKSTSLSELFAVDSVVWTSITVPEIDACIVTLAVTRQIPIGTEMETLPRLYQVPADGDPCDRCVVSVTSTVHLAGLSGKPNGALAME